VPSRRKGRTEIASPNGGTEMRMRTALTAFAGASAVAATVALAVPASAAPSPAALTSGAGAAPAVHCTLRAFPPHVSRGKARGDGRLACDKTVTNIVLKVKLYREGKLRARTVARKSSGRSLSAQASRTCSDSSPGFFVTVVKAQFTYLGARSPVGTAQSRPVLLDCGF
jgi:hypothetical protein